MQRPSTFINQRYRVIRLIGEGGMGRVFSAVDEHTGRRVAVKLLREELIGGKSIDRFRMEAAIVRELKHDNICEILAVGQNDAGTPFYIMPLLVGQTLSSRLEGRTLSYESAVDISMQLLSGLEAVHGRRIVHRDLKTKNVFLVRNHPELRYLVKILDFGVSKMPDTARKGLTDTGTVLGSVRYMAPEQARASKHIDTRVDIYSAGIILYEIFTGEHPLSSLSPAELNPMVPKVYKPPRSINDALPAPLERVIITAMSHNPHERYLTGADMRRAFVAALKEIHAGGSKTEPLRKETDLRIRKPRLSDLI